ncbi:MAG: PAS domain S-box protein [Syntrophobacteraceae bacterium]
MTSNLDPPPLKTRFFRSIQGKLILLLVILIIPNFFILTYMYYDRFQSRRAEELQANLELARALSMNFETFFKDILIDELLIGTALTSSQPSSNQDQNRILAKARTMRSTFRQLFWVNPDGRILAATDSESIGIDLTDSSYFREILAGQDIVVSDLILSKKTGRPTFTISRGIRSEGSDLIGIVIAEIAPDELQGVLGIQRSLDASVSILDSKGMLVYRYPVTNYTWEQRNRLAQVPVLEDALKSKEIVAKVTSVSTGKPQLAAFAPIPSIGWVSEASRAEDVVMDAVTFKLLPQAGMRLFVTITAFGIALVVLRKISTSIGKLRDHVLALGRGGSQTPVAMSGTAELDDLANAFNRMTDDLESRQWEQKLAEQALRESEARLRQIIDLVPHMIFAKDWDGKYLLANKAVAEANNTSVSALTGKYHADFHPDASELQNMLRDDREVMTKGETKFIPEEPYTDAHGNLRFHQTTKVPFHIFGDKTPAVLGVAIDITNNKRAEEVLRESEEQFRTLVGSAPDAIFIQVEGRFAYVNDAAIRMYGAESEKELLSHDIVERVHPDYRARILERIPSVNEEGEPAPLIEQKHVKLDGTTIYVEAHSAPIRYQKGEGTLVFVRDITERKRTEESLLLSEDRYRRLFEDAVLGIFRSTPDGKLINVNPAYARMFGFDSPEESKIHVNDAVVDPYSDPSRQNEIMRMIFDAEGSIRAENLYRRKDGNIFTGNLHAWAVRDREGKPLYIEGFVEDITERKHAEEEKEMLEAQLLQARKLEAIGTLAGGIAHDFNNVLAPIIGYTELALSDTPQLSPMRHGLEQILNAAMRARDLVKQILAFGRPGKKQQKMPVQISSIVKEALKLLRASLPSSIEIRQNIENGVASADSTQIHQVLLNLCTNAAHAMGDKGILEVSLFCVDLSKSDLAAQSIVDLKPGPYLKLCISDTGSGMDTATLERIFDPYFTTKEVGKGSGLGLAVVHGIVKRHDGAITVQSEPGKGSTFSIYIPAVEAGAGVVIETGQVLPTGSERIFLIDDEPILVEMGTAILERLGYEVTPETDSLRALEIFRSRPDEFDLIITDYTMPNLTGIDLSREIRQIQPDIPIILCTGFSEKVTEESAVDLGVGLVMKPFSMKQIAELVRKVLRARES